MTPQRWRVLSLVIAGLMLAGRAQTAAAAEVLGARVVGGSIAPDGKWPFQAFLMFQSAEGKRYQCGATLIAPRWLLTAAHCAFAGDGRPMKPQVARIGSVSRDAGGITATPLRVLPHPQFSKSTLVNDVALVELESPVSLPVARLDGLDGSRRQQLASPFVTVLGWGRTDSGAPSRFLQEAEMPLVEPSTCNQALSADPGLRQLGPVDGRRLCAGLSEGGVDSCNGDSGGPLLQGSEGRWVQLGIVSYGTPSCGRPGAYGVYTRIAAFRDWIDGVTGGAGPKSPPQSPMRPGGVRPQMNPPAKSSVPAAPVIGAVAAAPKLAATAAAGTALRLTMSRQSLRLGDRFELNITSPVDGWLVLYDESNDGKVVQLFPNNRSRLAGRDGRVRAGATLRIPDDSYGFAFVASEPRGRGRITALVLTRRQQLGRTSPADAFKPRTDAAAWLGGFENSLTRSAPAEGSGRSGWLAATVSYVVR